MNKSEVVQWIANKTEMSDSDVERVVNSYHACITERLAEGDQIVFVGFGSYKVSNRAERMGRNLQTGEKIRIPASKAPVFKPAKSFKETVNKKK